MAPENIGPWKVERTIGKGGMGTVYLTHHSETNEVSAVKLLPASLAREEGFVRRFQREISVLQKLTSPHIVQFLESGEAADETYYYAMEYVDGETLTDRLKREKRLHWREVIDLSVQICLALKAAHDMGVVHRDLKPSNLLLAGDGAVKLTDFGVAHMFAGTRLTKTGGIIGTAEYMSPEQAQGRRVTKQSDLYALGAVMYAMLTGRPPFTGNTTMEIVRQHQFGQFDMPTRYVPEIPYRIEQVVCQLLEKEPDKRFPDAYVLLKKLQEVKATIDYADNAEQTLDLGGTGVDSSQPTSVGEERVGPGSATMMRDLMRFELERDKAGSPLENLLNNTWVLLTLLVLVIGGAIWINRSNNMNAEDRFDRAVELMEKDPGPPWFRARDEYFKPLVDEDPDAWSEKIGPYLAQIERFERADDLRKLLTRITVPRTQPERLLLQAYDLIQAGEHDAGHKRLLALSVVLDGLEPYEHTLQTVRELLAAIDEQNQPQQSESEFMDELVKHAGELEESGKSTHASRVLNAIGTLYPVHQKNDEAPVADSTETISE